MKKLTICVLLLTPALYGMKRKAEEPLSKESARLLRAHPHQLSKKQKLNLITFDAQEASDSGFKLKEEENPMYAELGERFGLREEDVLTGILLQRQRVRPLTHLISSNQTLMRQILLHAILSCTSLVYLDLSRNNLFEIPAAAIGQLRQLRTLLLAHNNLRRIPLDLMLLPKLEKLDVSDNLLEDIDLATRRSLRKPTLGLLDIRDNRLSDEKKAELVKKNKGSMRIHV